VSHAPALVEALERLIACSHEAIDAARVGDTAALHSALDRRELAVVAAMQHPGERPDRARIDLALEAVRLGDELAAIVAAARDDIGRELVRAHQTGAGVAAYAEGGAPAPSNLDLRR
jgi:hypothetical protein